MEGEEIKIRVPNTAESADDIKAWVVIDDEVKDDDSEGMTFCPSCISKYFGDGEIIGQTKEELRGDISCECCGQRVSTTNSQ